MKYKTKVQAHPGLSSLYCHDKMVLADYGTSNVVAFIGSVYLSTGSIEGSSADV